jgi:hypothetical protein
MYTCKINNRVYVAKYNSLLLEFAKNRLPIPDKLFVASSSNYQTTYCFDYGEAGMVPMSIYVVIEYAIEVEE